MCEGWPVLVYQQTNDLSFNFSDSGVVTNTEWIITLILKGFQKDHLLFKKVLTWLLLTYIRLFVIQ